MHKIKKKKKKKTPEGYKDFENKSIVSYEMTLFLSFEEKKKLLF